MMVLALTPLFPFLLLTAVVVCPVAAANVVTALPTAAVVGVGRVS